MVAASARGRAGATPRTRPFRTSRAGTAGAGMRILRSLRLPGDRRIRSLQDAPPLAPHLLAPLPEAAVGLLARRVGALQWRALGQQLAQEDLALLVVLDVLD